MFKRERGGEGVVMVRAELGMEIMMEIVMG